jgi:PII-like signaling protein
MRLPKQTAKLEAPLDASCDRLKPLLGFIGFGKSSHLHTAKGLRLSKDLPILIEIVDTPEKISAFLPELDAMMKGGLVTLERAQVIRYKHAPQKRSFG